VNVISLTQSVNAALPNSTYGFAGTPATVALTAGQVVFGTATAFVSLATGNASASAAGQLCYQGPGASTPVAFNNAGGSTVAYFSTGYNSSVPAASLVASDVFTVPSTARTSSACAWSPTRTRRRPR
jgi:hypothetical protein